MRNKRLQGKPLVSADDYVSDIKKDATEMNLCRMTGGIGSFSLLFIYCGVI